MNLNGGRQIENLCHESLSREPDERAGFLDAACAGDADLRGEVESLLKYAGPTDDPLDRSTGEGVTRLVGELMEPTLLPGTNIGPYRIETVLGAGGMGKVYRALDMRLGRAVALKFLNGPFFADGSERLMREARAAARLDHPNICSIHEVVEDESRCFIVMQYVEGEPLANRLARKPVDVSEALEITSQIADALGEAHARGIVHRDVKPQNIMITPRGQAKVLDFGLATSVTPIDASKSEVETPKHVTEKGLVAGTVGYMSPEQARGQELDARTDLFSLGVVLFEMAAGVSPFRRTTVPLTFDAILNHPPAPPRQINPNCRPNSNASFSKGSRRTGICATSRLLNSLADLKRLQRDLLVAPSTEAAPPARRTWRHLGYALAGLVIAAVVATFVLSRSEAPPSTAELPRYVQLTNFTDSATNPAVSPDGRMLAFIRGSSTFLNQGQVYLKRLPDGEPVPLTRDDRRKMAPVFSPDGSRIVYTVYDVRRVGHLDGAGAWRRAATDAGERRRADVDSATAVSCFRRSNATSTWPSSQALKAGPRSGTCTCHPPRMEWPTGRLHRLTAGGFSSRPRCSPAAGFRAELCLSLGVPPEESSARPTHNVPARRGRRTGIRCISADLAEVFTPGASGSRMEHRNRSRSAPLKRKGLRMWPDGRFFVSSVGTTVSSI